MSLIPSTIPEDWQALAPRLAGRITVESAGQHTTVELTPGHLRGTFLPLLALLVARCGHVDPQHRVIAGLAGIPGGGKSVFAACLAFVADRVLRPGFLAVVGMDGWHYPNAVLDQRWTTDPAGARIALRRRKGGPESYDVAALVEGLRAARSAQAALNLPVYDRRRHDPVAGGLTVPVDCRVVLIEGNYLLHERPPWNQVRPLLDVSLYLASDAGQARRRIVARHMRGGVSEREAVGKYELNDAPNTALVQSTAGRADYVLRF